MNLRDVVSTSAPACPQAFYGIKTQVSDSAFWSICLHDQLVLHLEQNVDIVARKFRSRRSVSQV